LRAARANRVFYTDKNDNGLVLALCKIVDCAPIASRPRNKGNSAITKKRDLTRDV
jgi:hypothetical protein